MSYMVNKDYMVRVKPKPAAGGWEVRPGGMLVQQRTSDANANSNYGGLVPTIRVRVKHGSSCHEVVISSQASFGELKKILAARTGLNVQEQKLVFKDRERHSRDFLDFCGVKDGSRVLLLEDDEAATGRTMHHATTNTGKAAHDIAAIRFEVDKLGKQVESAEIIINGGKRIVEGLVLNLIEGLMTQLIKLDGIAAEGDLRLQRRMEVKRVQKYIETLDVLKVRNSGLGKKQQLNRPVQKTFHKQKESHPLAVTKWEAY